MNKEEFKKKVLKWLVDAKRSDEEIAEKMFEVLAVTYEETFEYYKNSMLNKAMEEIAKPPKF